MRTAASLACPESADHRTSAAESVFSGSRDPTLASVSSGSRDPTLASDAVAELVLGDLLDRFASSTPTPGGGGASALAGAMAAALAAMAARLSSRQLVEAESIALDLDKKRAALVDLADRDGAAYQELLAALRGAVDRDKEAAWRLATEIPLSISEGAAAVAETAAMLVDRGNPNLAGDARAAVRLADAASHAAADLVAINVRAGALDPVLTERAEAAARRSRQVVDQLAGAPKGSSTE
jgi:formiminotetrahydrofolate cyclodeaminase